MSKLKNQYTINLDDDTSKALEDLARITQRKPRELLRLLVTPLVWEQLGKVTLIESKTEVAHFEPSPKWWDKLPRLEDLQK